MHPCSHNVDAAECLPGLSTLQDMGISGFESHVPLGGDSLTCVMLLLLRSSWRRLSNEYTPAGICVSAHRAMCKVCSCVVRLTSMLPAAGMPAPSTDSW